MRTVALERRLQRVKGAEGVGHGKGCRPVWRSEIAPKRATPRPRASNGPRLSCQRGGHSGQPIVGGIRARCRRTHLERLDELRTPRGVRQRCKGGGRHADLLDQGVHRPERAGRDLGQEPGRHAVEERVQDVGAKGDRVADLRARGGGADAPGEHRSRQRRRAPRARCGRPGTTRGARAPWRPKLVSRRMILRRPGKRIPQA